MALKNDKHPVALRILLLLAALLPLQLFAQNTEPDCGFYGNKTVEERNALGIIYGVTRF